MEFKIRLLQLAKKQVDLLNELHKMGYKEVTAPRLSTAINRKDNEPKAELIRKLCDEILARWESEV